MNYDSLNTSQRSALVSLASCTLGDETLTPEQFSSGIEKEFHRLSQDVWRQYQEWSAAIAQEIEAARQEAK